MDLEDSEEGFDDDFNRLDFRYASRRAAWGRSNATRIVPRREVVLSRMMVGGIPTVRKGRPGGLST
jgi:hypothetical protein